MNLGRTMPRFFTSGLLVLDCWLRKKAIIPSIIIFSIVRGLWFRAPVRLSRPPFKVTGIAQQSNVLATFYFYRWIPTVLPNTRATPDSRKRGAKRIETCLLFHYIIKYPAPFENKSQFSIEVNQIWLDKVTDMDWSVGRGYSLNRMLQNVRYR